MVGPGPNYLLSTKKECVEGILHLVVVTLGETRDIPQSLREVLEEVARRASGALGSKDFYMTTAVLEQLRKTP
jgi:hypothetical protein